MAGLDNLSLPLQSKPPGGHPRACLNSTHPSRDRPPHLHPPRTPRTHTIRPQLSQPLGTRCTPPRRCARYYIPPPETQQPPQPTHGLTISTPGAYCSFDVARAPTSIPPPPSTSHRSSDYTARFKKYRVQRSFSRAKQHVCLWRDSSSVHDAATSSNPSFTIAARLQYGPHKHALASA